MNTVRVERFGSQFEFSPERLRLTGIQMTGLHGKAEGQFTVESPFCCAALQSGLSIGQDRLAGSFSACRTGKVRLPANSAERSRPHGSTKGKQLAGEGHLRISEAPQEPAAHGLTWSNPADSWGIEFCTLAVEFPLRSQLHPVWPEHAPVCRDGFCARSIQSAC